MLDRRESRLAINEKTNVVYYSTKKTYRNCRNCRESRNKRENLINMSDVATC